MCNTGVGASIDKSARQHDILELTFEEFGRHIQAHRIADFCLGHAPPVSPGSQPIGLQHLSSAHLPKPLVHQ